MHSVDR